MSFNSKDNLVFANQLRIEKVSLPFTLTANATPASKTYTKDDPAILFLSFQGKTDEVSAELTALGDTLGSFQTPTDASGTFNALVVVNEPVYKIISGKLVYRDSSGSICAEPVNGISTPSGYAMGFNCLSAGAASLATTSINCSFEVEYIVKQS